MNLINLQTLEYPVSIYAIKAANPNVSYPDLPDYVPSGYAAVEPTPFPEYDGNAQRCEELPPAQTGGKWKQVWRVVSLSNAEKQAIRDAKAAAVRKQRDALLAQSDWTQLADAPVDASAWAVYRQALRDVPAQTGFPFDVQWPVKP